MYSVTIAAGNISWRFMYRRKDDAERLKTIRRDAPAQDLLIEDDFGQWAEIRASSIHGILVEDMETSRIAHVEGMIWNARIQKGAQDRLRREPGLMTNGPTMPIVNPVQ